MLECKNDKGCLQKKNSIWRDIVPTSYHPLTPFKSRYKNRRDILKFISPSPPLVGTMSLHMEFFFFWRHPLDELKWPIEKIISFSQCNFSQSVQHYGNQCSDGQTVPAGEHILNLKQLPIIKVCIVKRNKHIISLSIISGTV